MGLGSLGYMALAEYEFHPQRVDRRKFAPNRDMYLGAIVHETELDLRPEHLTHERTMDMTKSRNFVYFSPNDKDVKDDFGDCVVRALCKALDKTWLEVFDLLVEKARASQCMPSDKPAYEGVLRDHDFVYYGVSNKKGTKRPTVKKFAADEWSISVMVVAHHLVASRDGKFFDTWDSGEKSLYGYWVYKRGSGGVK